MLFSTMTFTNTPSGWHFDFLSDDLARAEGSLREVLRLYPNDLGWQRELRNRIALRRWQLARRDW